MTERILPIDRARVAGLAVAAEHRLLVPVVELVPDEEDAFRGHVFWAKPETVLEVVDVRQDVLQVSRHPPSAADQGRGLVLLKRNHLVSRLQQRGRGVHRARSPAARHAGSRRDCGTTPA